MNVCIVLCKEIEHFGRQTVRVHALVAYNREFSHLNVADPLHHKNNDFSLMTDADEISYVKTFLELVNSLRLQMEMHYADMQRLVSDITRMNNNNIYFFSSGCN